MKNNGKYSYKVSLGSHDSRLKKGPSKEVIDHLYSQMLDANIPTFEQLMRYNEAHMLELYEKNVISKEDAAKIVETSRWIEKKGLQNFKLDPGLEDLMPNIEAILISKLGEDLGGKILTGRARGDASWVASRLLLRNKILDLLQEVHSLRRLLLEMAKKHIYTIMPGYTHVQHAQPTTLGHYLVCVAEALETDCSRLEDAYKRVNTSPAEFSIGQGTGYPIDRKRVSALLGFEGIMENTRYAFLSLDRVVETFAALAILAVNMNRFSDDLYYWCTYEFGMVELADEYSATSYIMPQKKNPYVLEALASLPIRAITAFTSDAFRLNRLSFGLATNIVSVMKQDPTQMIDDIIGAIKMLFGVVSTLTVNEDKMKERAGIYFTQGTEIADTLVGEKGLSFRTAHKIVGALVREAIAKGKEPSDITPDMVDKAALEIIGKPVNLSPKSLSKALDVMEVVKARKVLGGVAPTAVKISINHRSKRLDKDIKGLGQKRERLAAAREDLEKGIQKLLRSKISGK
jgi:argininosuccinate lyase